MKISVQRLKAFKSCRRFYELRYVEDLVPTVSAEALQTGKKYHAYIDAFFKGEPIEETPTKEYAMFVAFLTYVYPKLRLLETEKKFVYELPNGELVGILDGVEETCFVEHKTTSDTDLEHYEYMLDWDEQILAYMLATGFRKVKYTVIRKPNIRQKKDESDEDFYKRMLEWYQEDTDSKIRLLTLTRTDEEVEEFKNQLISMIDEMQRAKDNHMYYRNNCACNQYGRVCEYASICKHYNKDQPNVNFTRREEVEFNEGDNTKWNF